MAVAGRGLEGDQHRHDRLRHAARLHAAGELLVAQMDDLHGLARNTGRQRGDLVVGERLGAAQRVDGAAGGRVGEGRGDRRRDVGTRDEGGAALAGGAVPLAGRDRARQRAEQVLRVPAVAEDQVGQAGRLHRLLGAVMVGREADLGDVRSRQRGIGDALDAGLRRGLDRRLLLAQAGAGAVDRVGRDDEHGAGAGEGLLQPGGVVEVDPADGDAAGGEVGQPVGVAGAGDDARRRHALRADEVVDDGAAEMARGAGDEDRVGHG